MSSILFSRCFVPSEQPRPGCALPRRAAAGAGGSRRSPMALCRRAAQALAFCAAAAAVQAQPHSVRSGEYELRASSISAAILPDVMRELHSIPSARNTGVLNVTVRRRGDDGALRNVPASVDARVRNLYGVESAVQMRRVVSDGFVSYLGVYPFLPREVLDFRITAIPDGTDRSLALEFRDRLPRR